MSLVLLAGALHALVLGVYFILKPTPVKSLGYFLLVIFTVIFEIFLNESGVMKHILILRNFSEPLTFLVGPLVYFTYCEATNRPILGKYIHLIPFLLYSLWHIYLVGTYWDSLSSLYASNYSNLVQYSEEYPLSIHAILTLSQLGIYTSYTFFQYRKNPETNSWIEFFIWGYVACFVSYGVIAFLFPLAGNESYYAIIIMLYVYGISYFALRYPASFIFKRKYAESPLDDKIKKELLRKLSHEMRVNKWYTIPNLSLDKLAVEIDISRHYLSQVINEEFNTNFSQYLNELRVEEAKKLLKRPDLSHLKLSEIGLMAGYNSKSSFYHYFKLKENTTPLAYSKSSTL
ncbi:MAG: helix-turn-helix transcriptional regulator [Fulvivirga sp.]|uniref:helix-turn-helix domain-containing protein n=1 Tax=Fulvivirga sp. TaxID=1931237 RepID=UPI0032EE6D37